MNNIKETIVNKIDSGDINFSLNELAIIAADSILTKKFFIYFKNNPNLIEKYMIEINFVNTHYDKFNHDLNLFLSNISDEILPYLVLNNVNPESINKISPYDVLASDASYDKFISNIRLKEYNDLALHNFVHHQSNNRGFCELIIKMLDKKDYPELAYILNKQGADLLPKRALDIDYNLFERIIKEIPLNEYQIDISKIKSRDIHTEEDKNKLLMDNIDKIDVNNLLMLFCYYKEKSPSSVDEINKLENVIKDKLASDCSINLNMNFSRMVLLDNYDNFFLPIISKGLNEKNVDLFLYFNVELNDNQIDEICRIIESKGVCCEIFNKFISKNNKIYNSLFKIGKIDLKGQFYTDEMWSNISNTILDSIRKNDKNFLNKLEIPINIEKLEDVIVNLIENDYFKSLVIPSRIATTPKIKEALIEKIVSLSAEQIMNIQFIGQFIKLYDPKEIFDLLVAKRQYDKIAALYSCFKKVIDIDTACDLIKNNNIFAICYIEDYNEHSRIIRNEKIFKTYISLSYDNPIYMNALLNTIEQDENCRQFNYDYLYGCLKDYFIKKYDFKENEIKHLNYLTEKYGPTIIRFISNINIQKIIKLDDVKFDKLMNLFSNKASIQPVELEAIYDSFKQMQFAKENPDIINIFSNITHSLSFKDIPTFDSLMGELIPAFEKRKSRIEQKIQSQYIDYDIIPLTNEANKKIKQIISYYQSKGIILTDIHIKEEDKRKIETEILQIKIELEENIKKIKLRDDKDKKFYERELEKFKEFETTKEYFDYLAKQLSSGIDNEKYLNILKCITDEYILSKREEYRKTYDLVGDAKLPFTEPEENKKIYQKLLVSKYLETGLVGIQNNFYNQIFNELKNASYNGEPFGEEYARTIIYAYIGRSLKDHYDKCEYDLDKHPKYEMSIQFDDKVKKGLALLKQLCEEHYEEISSDRKLSESDSTKIKKDYYVESKKFDGYSMFSDLRMDLIESNILEDEEVYTSLKQIIDEYKLNMLTGSIDNILRSINKDKTILDYSCNTSDITAFISFYHKIYKEKMKALNNDTSKKIKFNYIELFDYMDKYASIASIYSQILGVEDAGLIRSDPGEYKSKLSKTDKLNAAIEMTFDNFKKSYVRVPSCNIDVDISNGRKMNIIVGNYTKPTNLTHGERTGACMRIGGAGEGLLYSKESFHIEFNDLETGEYISRVTGFRNGNTIFLNELRFSCNTDLYSDDMVREACEKISQILIEMSKDSPCPVENVVIEKNYSYEDSEKEIVDLKEDDLKAGLSEHFYSDIKRNNGIVLATTATNGEKFVPLNLDNSLVPYYPTARERVKVWGKNSVPSIIEQINRIYTINCGLNGNYMVAPLVDSDNLLYALAGEDWYVYLDDNNKVNSFRMDRDERSKEEFETALQIIEEYKNSINPDEEELKYAI